MNLATKRIIAGISAAAMLAVSVPTQITNAADENSGTSGTKVIYSTDFEDGDMSAFSNRGGGDVTELTDSTEQANSGTHSMKMTQRTKSWGGPSINVSKICNAGEQYQVSLSYYCPWYSDATLSMQYTDSEGTQHYSNIAKIHSEGTWGTLEPVKFSFSDSMKDVQLYLEGTGEGSYMDDFKIETVPEVEIEEDIPSLSDVYKGYFKIGTAITNDNLADKPFMKLVKKHFSGSMTCGNEMKPESVLQQKGCHANAEAGDETMPAISLASAEPIINYCIENKIPMRAHTLVWHSQTPDWFFKEGFKNDGEVVSKEVMLKRMENYIKLYFEALQPYIDKGLDVYACDVVNEAWLDDGSPRQPGEQGSNGSNNSMWVKVFGDNSFIEPAFTYARKYAPKGCKLYYNDFNEYMLGKRDKIVEMATDLKSKGLIDGIGMQSHLAVNFPLTQYANNSPSYKKALDEFSKTGLDIQVTELDATTDDTSEAGLKKQAEYYSAIFDDLVEYKDSISAVVIWGVTDSASWRAKKEPLLFDGNYKAKPAFYSVTDDVPSLGEDTTTTTETVDVTTTTTAAGTTTVTEPTETTQDTTTAAVTTATTPEQTTAAATTETTVATVTTDNTTTADVTETTAEPKVTTTAKATETTQTAPTTAVTTTENESTETLPSGVKASKYGDVDENGLVNVADVVLLNKSLVGADNITDLGKANAECLADGKLDSKDASAILAYLASLCRYDDLPVSEVPADK